MRQRRSYAVRLQEEVASKAVAQERLRIARELHDVVAHSMSVIAVQAGYGQYVMDSQPQDARDALGAIQATSREALDEMRRMLGALRQADDADARQNLAGTRPGEPGAQRADADTRQRAADPGPHDAGSAASPLFPAPGLADLDRLISRTAGGGRAGRPDAVRAASRSAPEHRPVGVPDRPGGTDQCGQARPDELVPGPDRLPGRRADHRGHRRRRAACRSRDWPAPG